MPLLRFIVAARRRRLLQPALEEEDAVREEEEEQVGEQPDERADHVDLRDGMPRAEQARGAAAAHLRVEFDACDGAARRHGARVGVGNAGTERTVE